MAQYLPNYAPASRSLRLGACKRIISSLKEVNTFTNPDLATVLMLARGKLESSSSLQVTFTVKLKSMIRMMYVAITRRGVWGAKPNFSPST